MINDECLPLPPKLKQGGLQAGSENGFTIHPSVPFIYDLPMNLKDLVVVTGMPGVQRVAANRSNGMMVEDLDTGKVRFASVRKHQFSPLESISIYTDDDDAVEIKKVFQNMMDLSSETPPAAVDAKPEALREYFSLILPNHDRERVHISDIKKVIRWYHFLNERGFLTMEEEAGDEEE